MADFKQVIQWLKEGKKVRRKCFNDKNHFLVADEVYIYWEKINTSRWNPDMLDLQANDWEIYGCKHENNKIVHSKESNEYNLIDSIICCKIKLCKDCGHVELLDTSIGCDHKEERYPLCQDQKAQIDCRRSDCEYYLGAGMCSNISPAITLNPDKNYVCWSSKETKSTTNKQ